jgi:hypothetical protein
MSASSSSNECSAITFAARATSEPLKSRDGDRPWPPLLSFYALTDSTHIRQEHFDRESTYLTQSRDASPSARWHSRRVLLDATWRDLVSLVVSLVASLAIRRTKQFRNGTRGYRSALNKGAPTTKQPSRNYERLPARVVTHPLQRSRFWPCRIWPWMRERRSDTQSEPPSRVLT